MVRGGSYRIAIEFRQGVVPAKGQETRLRAPRSLRSKAIHFHGYQILSRVSQEEVREMATLLSRSHPGC